MGNEGIGKTGSQPVATSAFDRAASTDTMSPELRAQLSGAGAPPARKFIAVPENGLPAVTAGRVGSTSQSTPKSTMTFSASVIVEARNGQKIIRSSDGSPLPPALKAAFANRDPGTYDVMVFDNVR
jgi:hypothetical protein